MQIIKTKFALAPISLPTDEESRTISVVASSEALDSANDIVLQDWDFSRYDQNPVVLWAHDNTDFPIGRASNYRVEEGKLLTDITFARTPKAEEVWQNVKEGFLRGISAGFQSRNVKAEIRDGKNVFVLSDNLLHEISIVAVPANPEALIERLKSLSHSQKIQHEEIQPKMNEHEKLLTLTKAADIDAAHLVILEWQKAAHELVELKKEIELSKKSALIDKLRADGKALPEQIEFLQDLSIAQLEKFEKTASAKISRAPTAEPKSVSLSADSFRGKSFSELLAVKAGSQLLIDLGTENPELYSNVMIARKQKGTK